MYIMVYTLISIPVRFEKLNSLFCFCRTKTKTNHKNKVRVWFLFKRSPLNPQMICHHVCPIVCSRQHYPIFMFTCIRLTPFINVNIKPMVNLSSGSCPFVATGPSSGQNRQLILLLLILFYKSIYLWLVRQCGQFVLKSLFKLVSS